MREEERDADYLIKNGMLDKIEDIEVDGEKIPASVLGYRINAKFVNTFFGRVFQNPSIVFDEDMLKPELQVTAGCVCVCLCVSLHARPGGQRDGAHPALIRFFTA
jgi:hypothetical protein